jgi:acetyl-CoA acyltransferase
MSRSLREVVFVDGVRTPFGKAGPKGIYAETRADDLVVRVIRELLRRNPALPADRVDEVAIAATTQVGDQGLTIGRTAALLAGLPRSVPGYAIDRMCAGAMTAVTTTASGIAFGAYDVAIAGGVEHMGRHPMGEGADPNPRFFSEKLVDGSALVMGSTAENLHDRFPHLTRERADAFALASQQKYAKAVANGQIGPELVTVSTRSAEQGWGLATVDEPPRPNTTLEGLATLKTPVPPARQRDGGQRGRPQRRRHRVPPCRGGGRARARAGRRHAAGRLRVRRRRARGHGRRPGAVHRTRAGPQRSHHR